MDKDELREYKAELRYHERLHGAPPTVLERITEAAERVVPAANAMAKKAHEIANSPGVQRAHDLLREQARRMDEAEERRFRGYREDRSRYTGARGEPSPNPQRHVRESESPLINPCLSISRGSGSLSGRPPKRPRLARSDDNHL